MATTRKKFIKHDSVNLLPITASGKTDKGVTFSLDKNQGTVSLNGSSAAAIGCNIGQTNLSAGTYTFVILNKQSGTGFYLSNVGYQNTILASMGVSAILESVSFTLESDSTVYIWLHVPASTTYDNYMVKPMLLRGDMTSNLPPFEPYYNHKTIYKTYTRTANLIKITNWYTTISGLTITQKPNDSNTVTITGTSNRGAMAIANKNFYTADMLGKTITFSQSKKFTAWNDPAATFWQIWRDGKVYKITPTSSQTVTFEEGHTWSINVWCGTAGEKNYTISFWANEGAVAKPFQPYAVVTYKKHIVERT